MLHESMRKKRAKERISITNIDRHCQRWGLLKNRTQHGCVDAHIKFNAYSLWAGPHNLPDDFEGLFVSMQGDAHDNRFADRDISARLNKDTPAVDIGDKVDEAEIHGCAADF